jgi:hypothetical protein
MSPDLIRFFYVYSERDAFFKNQVAALMLNPFLWADYPSTWEIFCQTQLYVMAPADYPDLDTPATSTVTLLRRQLLTGTA